MLRHSVFMPRQSLVKTKSFDVAKKNFYVAIELAKVKTIYVVTGYSYIAIEFGLDRRF